MNEKHYDIRYLGHELWCIVTIPGEDSVNRGPLTLTEAKDEVKHLETVRVNEGIQTDI